MILPGYPESQHEANDSGPSRGEWGPPKHLRPAMRWIALALLLIVADSLVSMIAQQHHLSLHRSVLGFALFLIPVAGLACLGVAALSWRQGSRNAGH
jgi:hypothetical protein